MMPTTPASSRTASRYTLTWHANAAGLSWRWVVLLPTARAGISITGMDISPDMLHVLSCAAACEPDEVRRRIAFVEGDMRGSAVSGRFAIVTAPFRVVQHLLKRADQRAWLRNVKRHLSPGGLLCFDVFQFDPQYLNRTPTIIDRTEPETGCRIRRFDSLHSLTALQILDVHMEWVKENAAGERVWSQRADCQLRWFTRAELENLLELEGFEIVDYWGSFARQPFGADSQQQIIRAQLSV
jgi:SAM-dependent methyltransferase